jgi:hypothetical protein
MSSFTVEWAPAAENELADIYNTYPTPVDVTKADAAIDRILSFDPIGRGTHIAEGLYRCVIAPLAVYFSVDLAARKVEVSHVHTTRP